MLCYSASTTITSNNKKYDTIHWLWRLHSVGALFKHAHIYCICSSAACVYSVRWNLIGLAISTEACRIYVMCIRRNFTPIVVAEVVTYDDCVAQNSHMWKVFTFAGFCRGWWGVFEDNFESVSIYICAMLLELIDNSVLTYCVPY